VLRSLNLLLIRRHITVAQFVQAVVIPVDQIIEHMRVAPALFLFSFFQVPNRLAQRHSPRVLLFRLHPSMPRQPQRPNQRRQRQSLKH